MQKVIEGRPAYLWRDGSLVPWADATVHVNAVGHASVSTVFEGIKAYAGADDPSLYVFRLEDHLQRLLDSARIARLRCSFTLEELHDAAYELLRANRATGDTYIRPWLFAQGVIYEHIVPVDVETHCVIDTWRFESRMLHERSCRACVSSWTRIRDNSMPSRLKAFSNYHNGRLGMIEAHVNGYDWPIFLNDRGKVAEGPGACVGVVRKGRLITPPVTADILESITRDSILELASSELGIPVDEREVDRTELYVADELFFVGTGWEILPIVDIDGLVVGTGSMGPVTRALDRVYHDLVRGRLDAYQEWLAQVPTAEVAETVAARGEEAR